PIHPVESVSWNDAATFCAKVMTKSALSGGLFRLPTEAEWEYACRGGAPCSHHLVIRDGRSRSRMQANFNGDFPFGGAAKGSFLQSTTPVGHFKLVNGFGLFDMHGNVGEWCADWYGPYSALSTSKDPFQDAQQDNDRRVLRGGSWY